MLLSTTPTATSSSGDEEEQPGTSTIRVKVMQAVDKTAPIPGHDEELFTRYVIGNADNPVVGMMEIDARASKLENKERMLLQLGNDQRWYHGSSSSSLVANIFVDPKWRRKGLASQLLDYAEEKVKTAQEGWSLMATVSESNEAMIPLLQSRNYTLNGSGPSLMVEPGEKEQYISFRKQLKKPVTPRSPDVSSLGSFLDFDYKECLTGIRSEMSRQDGLAQDVLVQNDVTTGTHCIAVSYMRYKSEWRMFLRNRRQWWNNNRLHRRFSWKRQVLGRQLQQLLFATDKKQHVPILRSQQAISDFLEKQPNREAVLGFVRRKTAKTTTTADSDNQNRQNLQSAMVKESSSTRRPTAPGKLLHWWWDDVVHEVQQCNYQDDFGSTQLAIAEVDVSNPTTDVYEKEQAQQNPLTGIPRVEYRHCNMTSSEHHTKTVIRDSVRSVQVALDMIERSRRLRAWRTNATLGLPIHMTRSEAHSMVAGDNLAGCVHVRVTSDQLEEVWDTLLELAKQQVDSSIGIMFDVDEARGGIRTMATHTKRQVPNQIFALDLDDLAGQVRQLYKDVVDAKRYFYVPDNP